MTPDKRMDDMADDVKYIRARIDQHINEHAKDRVEIEKRLTSVEIRSGFWGVIGGVLTMFGIDFARRS